jgi:dTDP-4-amino-4,6-dideoxygalactose transaminase
LESGWYVMGQEVQAFEQEFAHFLGIKDSVAVNSGTDALHLALRALEIGLGDEVITVSHTAVATVAAIGLSGATAVLCDIDPSTYCMDSAEIEKLITTKTKAIVVVHLYGQSADLKAIGDICARHDLKLIEDCAQGIGGVYNDQPVGTYGDVGCFSFYPTKNLGALGDGGAVVSKDDHVIKRLKALREYGWDDQRNSQFEGLNSRMDEMQAAILRAKLPFFMDDVAKRQKLATIYNEALSDTGLILPDLTDIQAHSFHLYVVRVSEARHRNAVRQKLQERGVATGIHYVKSVDQQAIYHDQLQCGSLSKTHEVIKQIISLPLYPELTPDEQGYVIDQVKDVIKSVGM